MKIGLQGKIFTGLLILVIATMALMGYVLVFNAENRLQQFRLVQAKYQAHTLAEATLDSLIVENYEVLHGWVNAAIPSEDYAFAALIRPDGRVLTHTNIDMVGEQATTTKNRTSQVVRTSDYWGEQVKEVIQPITVGKKHLANAHVAYFMSKQSIIPDDSIPIRSLTIIFAVLALSFGSHVITKRLVNPLNYLSEEVTKVRPGHQLTLKDDFLHRTDEVGVLAQRFKELSDRLMKRVFEAELSEKKLQKEIDERLKATDANQTKSTFLANMSHELRTPLNAIIGYSELLIDEFNDVGSIHDETDIIKIKNTGEHLLHLINQILDLSKIESGKLEIYYSTIKASNLIDELNTAASPLATKNNNELQITCSDSIRTIYSDQLRLCQVLLNLLSNACKFTKNDKICLNFCLDDEQDPEWFIFTVKDNGIGMDAEQLAKIFNAFSQADASTTKKFGGTGLGLSISQLFCKKLGGNISVESTPNEGSTFTVRLPYKTSAETEIKKVS